MWNVWGLSGEILKKCGEKLPEMIVFSVILLLILLYVFLRIKRKRKNRKKEIFEQTGYVRPTPSGDEEDGHTVMAAEAADETAESSAEKERKLSEVPPEEGPQGQEGTSSRKDPEQEPAVIPKPDSQNTPVSREAQSRQEHPAVYGIVVNSKGLVRANNEDNFYLNGKYMRLRKMDNDIIASGSSRKGVQLYAVCDGMGGTAAGEEASFRAVRELAARKKMYGRISDSGDLSSLLQKISDRIYEESVEKKRKSGTTVAMLLVKNDKAMLANVGDSRIYLLRDRKLTQMSLDHTKVQKMLSMGLITPEDAKTSSVRHVITQYLGMPAAIRVYPYIVPDHELRKGDVYVLCSDGLTDMVEDRGMEEILNKNQKPEETVKELLKTALEKGGRDNVTIMLLYITG